MCDGFHGSVLSLFDDFSSVFLKKVEKITLIGEFRIIYYILI